MASNDHCHGLALDTHNSKVLCRYCRKVVSGFNRLEHHLGGVGTDATECPAAPSEVKDFFRCKLIDMKMVRAARELGDVQHVSHSTERERLAENDELRNQTQGAIVTVSDNDSSSPELVCSSIPPLSCRRDQSDSSVEVLHAYTTNGKENGSDCYAQSSGSKRAKRSLFNHLGETNTEGGACNCDDTTATSSTRGLDTLHVKRCIGRFLFENAIDFSAAESTSLRTMMELFLGSAAVRFLPTTHELKGWILLEEMTEIRHYVEEVRQSWKVTGCSIVLDGWANEHGHEFINVVVDCPRGSIYVKSLDISDASGDVDALEVILDSVLQDVGIQNVVQVISYTETECMDSLGRRLMDKHRSVFWTVSATRCISLMLERIGTRRSIRRVMQKAKTMITFVYSNLQVLELMRRYTDSHDLLKPCEIKAATDYMTLENILMQKEHIESMFGSSEWKNSAWESTSVGKYIAAVVADASFWDDVTVAVRAAIPLVNLLSSVNDNNPDMGWIYESVDRVKETIRDDLGEKTSKFKPFWVIIDEIWNDYLHSPLHVMGFILNPWLRYSGRYNVDKEVASGALITLVKMVADPLMQDLIIQQLDEYHNQKGAFRMGVQSVQVDNISPVEWWTRFGAHCPELQNFAIRILSQTCNGSSAYELKRDLAEKLLSSRINCVQKKQLTEFVYVHYHLQLQLFNQPDGEFKMEGEDIGPILREYLDEVVEFRTELQALVSSTSMCDTTSISSDGPSGSQLQR